MPINKEVFANNMVPTLVWGGSEKDVVVSFLVEEEQYASINLDSGDTVIEGVLPDSGNIKVKVQTYTDSLSGIASDIVTWQWHTTNPLGQVAVSLPQISANTIVTAWVDSKGLLYSDEDLTQILNLGEVSRELISISENDPGENFISLEESVEIDELAEANDIDGLAEEDILLQDYPVGDGAFTEIMDELSIVEGFEVTPEFFNNDNVALIDVAEKDIEYHIATDTISILEALDYPVVDLEEKINIIETFNVLNLYTEGYGWLQYGPIKLNTGNLVFIDSIEVVTNYPDQIVVDFEYGTNNYIGRNKVGLLLNKEGICKVRLMCNVFNLYITVKEKKEDIYIQDIVIHFKFKDKVFRKGLSR
jgi:hypothetical protein